MQSPERGRSFSKKSYATNGELASDTTMLTNGVSKLKKISNYLSTIAKAVYTASDHSQYSISYSHVNSATCASSDANKSQ